MKFWKTILALLLVTSLFFLAACGGEDEEAGTDDGGGQDTEEPAEDNTDDSGDTGSDTDGETVDKITIFQSKVEITEELEELAKIYEEETGVEVEVWGTTGDDYFQQLQIRLNSNQGPSIFSLRHLTEAMSLESYAYDLSDVEYAQYIAENMALEVNGKLLGIPFGAEGFGLVYNKDLIDPADVADYASFVNTLQEFDGTDVSGLSLSQEGFFLIGHISNYPFSLQNDNIAFMDQVNAGEVSLGDVEEFQAFGEMLEDIRAYTRNPLEVNYDSQIGDFASGKTAMIHQGNWAYGMFSDYELDFEMGMLPVPLMDNDSLAVGVGLHWSVNAEKDDAEIQAALDFLDWLHTTEIGHSYLVEEFNTIPALTNIEVSDFDPLSQAVFDAINEGKTIPWSHTYFPANLVVNDFVPVAENFFINESLTGQEVVEMMDDAWQNAIR
ncbi:ABC transporter substrate-binding protein [Evansella tamaricis]|uniref:ABC transporter substrate-binding protein n=1 Tax=Evansella tamaricis TaxID=2069301 RepID=A0ABS6JGE9_9BACI|nr:ABC transporter substrate-binding protein [Evansella tamaricis]MBU9712676.1 ABC transporter substrate-binding protein [Evansella tamaricis]